MRAPALVGIITALHILAITAFVFIQGCGTTRPTLHSSQEVGTPPSPTMPPKDRSIPVAPPRVVPTRTQQAPVVSVPADATSYTIVQGDTLSGVAKKYGVRTRELVEVNGLANPNSLKVGQVLLIPPHARSGSGSPSPATAPAASVTAATGGDYVVLAGDSLSKIASRFGVKVSDIKGANGLTGDRILVGQKLTIPGTDSPAASGTPTVASGDQPPTASGLTSSVADEITALSLTDDQSVEIPVIEIPDTAPPATTPDIPATNMAPQNKPIPYTVLAGDTLDEIAKLFIVTKADIMELNGLGPNDSLSEGQKLLIPPSDL